MVITAAVIAKAKPEAIQLFFLFLDYFTLRVRNDAVGLKYPFVETMFLKLTALGNALWMILAISIRTIFIFIAGSILLLHLYKIHPNKLHS